MYLFNYKLKFSFYVFLSVVLKRLEKPFFVSISTENIKTMKKKKKLCSKFGLIRAKYVSYVGLLKASSVVLMAPFDWQCIYFS